MLERLLRHYLEPVFCVVIIVYREPDFFGGTGEVHECRGTGAKAPSLQEECDRSDLTHGSMPMFHA